MSHVSGDHVEKESATVTLLQRDILRVKCEDPSLGSYQVAKRLSRDGSAVSHSWQNLKQVFAQFPLGEFARLVIEGQKAGVFEDKEAYVPKRYKVGRPALGIRWEDGKKVLGEPRDVERVRGIFNDALQGRPPSHSADKWKVSRGDIYKILRNRDYLKLRIIDEKTFNAVQITPKSAPRVTYKKLGLTWINGRLEPDEDAEKIKRMFERRKAEKYYFEIGKELGLDQFQARRIIRDPTYAGYRFAEGKLVRVTWITPIINLKTWQEVQGLNLRYMARQKQKESAVQQQRRVKDTLPAKIEQIAEDTGFKRVYIADKLLHMKREGEVVQLFDGTWHKKDALTDAIKQTIEQKNWRSFKVRSGWEDRDKILRILLSGPATWLQLIEEAKLNRGRVTYWLEVFMNDGIVTKGKGRHDKFTVPPDLAGDLRKLYAMLEAFRK